MTICDACDIRIESVVKVKNQETGSKYIQYGKNLQFFELIYVLSGSAEVIFNETVVQNKPGTIIFLPKGRCANYDVKILREEECIAIFFDAKFIAPPALFFDDFSKNAKIAAMFEKIYQVWLKKETGYYHECMSIFYAVLSEMERSHAKYMPNSKREKIAKAIEYIHEHYMENEFEYARLHVLCGISYTYFKKIFQECFYMTPSSYVRNLKIQRARELLTTRQFSVTQVADACGFQDLCYFSKVFKNETGVSPAAFQKSQK